jgi:molecular chaperone DnaK (HSP70)
MLKEAELQKERDQQIKELAEVKNEAETLIRSAEVPFPSHHCHLLLLP